MFLFNYVLTDDQIDVKFSDLKELMNSIFTIWLLVFAASACRAAIYDQFLRASVLNSG